MKLKHIISTLLLLSCAAANIAAQEAEEPVFDRGIGKANSLFIPKGTTGVGLNISYSNYNLGNGSDDAGYRMLFSLIGGVSGSLNTFGIAPQLSYFVADNISLGLKFDYSRTGFNLGSLNLALGDALNFGIKDINFLKQGYTGSITLRDYMPIANSKRFAIFAELNVSGTYAQSEQYNHNPDGSKNGTYQDIYKVGLGVIPGVVCFVTNDAAFEVSVGVLGFNYQKTVQTTNQVEVSQMTSNNANFKINLLSISLGWTYYIPSKHNRSKRAK